MKTCCRCGVEKTATLFSPNSANSDGLQSWCRDCRNERARERYRNNPNIKRKEQLKRKFGLSLEKYDTIALSQGNTCAICRQPETKLEHGSLRNLSVDHNHVTGALRGLLCCNCNYALGCLKENPETIAALLLYVNKWGSIDTRFRL